MTDDDGELFEDLSRRLLVAHRRVSSLDLPATDKVLVTKRLLAISDATKHDLRRASKRLDGLLADLDAGRLSARDRDA